MLEPTADLANLNDYLARMDRFTPSLWSFIVFLGLKRDLVGKAGLGDTEVFYETGYDPEAGYRQLLEADMTNPGFGAMFYDSLYKGYSPAGKNTLTLVTLQGFDHWKKHEKDYWAAHKDAYRAEKERMANILIRQGGSAPARAFQGDRGQRDRYAADQCVIHRQLSRRNLRLGPDPGQFQPAAPAACDAGSESVPLRHLDELRRRLQRRVGERPGVFRRDHGALATLKPSFARRGWWLVAGGWWMCHLIWKWPISIQAKACATPVHRQPHHRAQGHARGTFGQERLAVVEPSGAGDIQVYPRRRVGELLQEHGGRNRASVTAAHVGHVGEGAFQIILVIVLQRHVPHFFALRAGRQHNALAQRIVVGEQAHVDVPKRHYDGSGERSRIHQMRAAQLLRIAEGIRQNQAPFRIGVDHLNGFAGERGDDIAGALRPAARHVFDGGYQRVDRNGGLELREGAHGADRRRAAGHVVFHLLHAVGRLDGDAARVEGDAFAHQAQVHGAGRRGSGPIAQHDQGGRFGAADGHAQQAAHPKLGHAVAVEHLVLQAELLGHAVGVLGEPHGGQPVGRLIRQFPREVLGFGDDASALDCGVKLRTAFSHRHREALHRLHILFIRLVAIRFEISQDGAFHRGSRIIGAGLSGVEPNRGLGDGLRFQVPYGGANSSAQLRRVELPGLPRPHGQHSLRAHTRHVVQQRHLERLAGDLTRIEQLAQTQTVFAAVLKHKQH